MARTVAKVAAWIGAGATALALLAAWQELRFRAASAHGDTAFYAGWIGQWRGQESFTPAAGSHNLPTGLAGPVPPRRDAGSELVLPVIADPGYPLRVRVAQLDNSRDDPPRLVVWLEGESPAEIATLPGNGSPEGTRGSYEARLAGSTRCGTNRVHLRAIAGSWISLGRVEVLLERRWPSALATSAATAGCMAWLIAASAAGVAWRRRAGRAPWLVLAVGRAGLVLAASLVALAAGELAVRWIATRSPPVRNILYSARDPVERARSEDFLGWLRGHRCASLPCSTWNDGLYFDRNGFHTLAYEVAKPAGTTRLLGIGDSFMFVGGTVPYPDQLFARLSAEVRAASRRRRWETIDLGWPCIGIATETEILRHEGLRLDPDVVVWTIYLGNDVTDEQEGAPLMPEALAADRVGTHASAAWIDALARHLRLARLAAHLGMLGREAPGLLIAPCRPSPGAAHASERCGVLAPEETAPYDPDARHQPDDAFLRFAKDRVDTMYRVDGQPRIAPQIRLLVRRMAAARRLIADRRALVVVLPDALQVSAARVTQVLAVHHELRTTPLDFAFPHREVMAGLLASGLAVLDLAPPFEAAEREGHSPYQPNDEHLNVSGNHLAAGLIAAELERRGWL